MASEAIEDVSRSREELANMAQNDLEDLIAQLSSRMMEAAENLQFELAARLRDELAELKKELRAMKAAN
jgi:uvrABC system protein B